MNDRILVTGGAGYIGSHVCIALLDAGYEVTVLDNFSNSHPRALQRVAELAGRQPEVVEGDVRDVEFVDRLLSQRQITAVLHFAGLKAVSESAQVPLIYYDTNINGTLVLLTAMQRRKIQTLVFSSSATVYGDSATTPIREDAPRNPTNPYGRSKLMVEQILEDLCHSDPQWRVTALRYFNPIGAHPSGCIGENPKGVPNNLLPFVAQVAAGRQPRLAVFGNDYPTPDGTGIRDYIHVVDLAEGHMAALRYALAHPGFWPVNLGTGVGYSVLDVVRVFEQTCGHTIPIEVVTRRAGDVARCWADPARAADLFGWRATRDLHAMCRDLWRWQQQNPEGY